MDAAHVAGTAAIPETIGADVAAFDAAISVDMEHGGNLFGLPLWTDDCPGWFLRHDALTVTHWNTESSIRWAFWKRWWEGAKTGNPVDPALQLAIVQGIDDETWKDPDAVAARIVEIERQFDLLQDVRRVKRDLEDARRQVATVKHRSHNQPPELVDDAIALKRDTKKLETVLAELIAPLEEIEAELETPRADLARIKALASKLVKIAGEALKYCGEVGDVFVKKAAETLGDEGVKWAVRGGAATLFETSTGLGHRLLDFVQVLLR